VSQNGLKAQIRRFMPRTVRAHRILRGPLRGFRIVTSWHDYPGAILGRTERPLLEWFERNVGRDETWLDVGAHYGYTAIALSRLVGTRGRVFAFEPELATAGCLARTRELNHLTQLIVMPLGLGAPDALTVTSLPTVRGMVDRTVTAEGKPIAAFLSARLDWAWDHLCGGQRRIDGIKIDVQGMEVETLKGMTGLLREFTPRLVLEVHHGVDRGEILDLLESAGYARLGQAVDAPGGGEEADALYLDDRSYWFTTPAR
jgi:FkbM family methyltransferase